MGGKEQLAGSPRRYQTVTSLLALRLDDDTTRAEPGDLVHLSLPWPISINFGPRNRVSSLSLPAGERAYARSAPKFSSYNKQNGLKTRDVRDAGDHGCR